MPDHNIAHTSQENSNLKPVDLAIHQRAIETSIRYKKCEIDLITILQEVDQNKIYLKLKYASLYDYAVRALKLSESTSYNFITVARKAVEVPELKLAISSGELTVSKARKITPVINKENSTQWLDLAKCSTQKVIEKHVAQAAPSELAKPRAQYIAFEKLKVTFGLSEKVYNMLKRAQDLESKRSKSQKSIEDTLENLLELYLLKNDPLNKAERALTKACLKTGSKEIIKEDHAPLHRQPLKATLTHQVIRRDMGKCQHTYNDKTKCQSSHFTQVHHIIPISHGGHNELQNLITLCSGHHKARHLR